MSANDIFSLKRPENEQIYGYEAGSQERKRIKAGLNALKENPVEIPLIIDGKEVKTDNIREIRAPHDHNLILGKYHQAGKEEINRAIDTSLKAKEVWENTSWEKRASIFFKAATLLAGPKRTEINAATMLSQSKNVFQAEIDAACELIDFLRFNAYFMSEIYQIQPSSTPKILNRIEYRPLEGFIFAVSPFNFTSIGGNLPTAPALMGNTVIWKPASAAVYSNYFFMKILMRAGLPDGVINFIPGQGSKLGPMILKRPELAGVHFTGSVDTLNQMFKEVGANIDRYNTYPRIVGETGGKDFVFAHKSADRDELITALLRGAFEYQGQKCSAVSRSYISKLVWEDIREELVKKTENLKMGPVDDFTNFINAVIDENAFDKIKKYIEYAKRSDSAQVIAGGECNKAEGYYITPTIILTNNPRFRTMTEEIFGPVLTIYIYDDKKYEEALSLCDQTSPYGLTGSIFAKDRKAVAFAEKALKHAAGNFYINDKPTGAVVGQQPFGGSRKSGTNDKAGSQWNLMRWVSPRSIKENLNPPVKYMYPFMKEK